MDRIERDYFSWICRLVNTREHRSKDYSKLLKYLYETEFVYILDMDSNRAGDGSDLRYRFGYENELTFAEIAYYLDNHQCSVLEMMAAMALRCEEHITFDPNVGDRVGYYFWNMVESLGLIDQTNDRFNVIFTDKTIETFLNREYEPNGEGGLFTLKRCGVDLRQVEIWCQFMWYLEELERGINET